MVIRLVSISNYIWLCLCVSRIRTRARLPSVIVTRLGQLWSRPNSASGRVMKIIMASVVTSGGFIYSVRLQMMVIISAAVKNVKVQKAGNAGLNIVFIGTRGMTTF